MPGQSPPMTLRVAPHTIPAVREAVEESVDELHEYLLRLRRNGYISEPWLGDPESERSRVFYNSHVMDAAEGPYAALVAYEAELRRVLAALVRMEDGYRHTEGDNELLWGRA